MSPDYLHTPIVDVRIDLSSAAEPLEVWRQSLGQGGINSLPLPPRVLRGIQQLHPRLIRVFLQEFFHIYPEHGRFDWSRLDPYLNSFAQTGAQVAAAITIKPKPLYPAVDHSIWRPKDIAEWQHVIDELVRRYSVEKPIVTYWEIGNETDIGENGGSPYLIPDPVDYFQFYQMTIDPILKAFPEAKVGGPAACWITNEPLPGLLQRCRETGTQLDFISWHGYNNDPDRHAGGVETAKQLLADWPGERPEMLYTEWNKFFEILPQAHNPIHGTLGRNLSVEDMAFDSRRAAIVAASILKLMNAGLDWSFYYHIWDQTFYPETFRSFFSQDGLELMMEHWNAVPHRFGLFGVNGEVRPQYFVYWMLAQLGKKPHPVRVRFDAEPPLPMLVSRFDSGIGVFCVHADTSDNAAKVLQIQFAGVTPGAKRLTVHRIDDEQRWNDADLTLTPVECRDTYTQENVYYQVYLPPDSVALVLLEDIPLPPDL